jgi:tetratricopeptide (TPR) repeat protein
LLALAWVVVRRRSQRWQEDAVLEQAAQRVRADLLNAKTAAARDSAPRLGASLRALRAQLQLPTGEGQALLDRLETEAYSPSAAGQPLSSSLCADAEALLRAWQRAPRSRKKGPDSLALLWLPILATTGALAAAPVAKASGAAETQQKLRQARSLYQAALAESDRDRRRSGFAQAENLLRELASVHTDCPQLLSDWGSAALLAQEPGRAVLAYRRALRLDPTLSRARRNLSFLRDRLPDWLPRPKGGDAFGSLLFFQQQLTVAHRHVLLSLLLLLASVLLSVPSLLRLLPRRPSAVEPVARAEQESPAAARGGERLRTDVTRLLARAAVLPLVLAVGVGWSIAAEPDARREAVLVLPGAVLRSADSGGAPPAFPHPLPAGAELRIDEPRAPYTRISLADGQSGWILSSTLEALVPERPNL